MYEQQLLLLESQHFEYMCNSKVKKYPYKLMEAIHHFIIYVIYNIFQELSTYVLSYITCVTVPPQFAVVPDTLNKKF